MRHLLHLLAVLVLVFGVQTTPLHAQSPAADGQPVITAPTGGAPRQEPIKENGIQEIIRKTGILFYPLLTLSVLAAVLILFYGFTIRQGTVVSDAFMNAADALIRKQDYLGLLAVCNRRSECVAKITAKTLDFATKNPTASFDEVREITEAEGNRQSSILTQRISYLADIGAIAPMVGLLGTVLGMVQSFDEIAKTSAAGSQQTAVAEGVSQALYTTVEGLVIGIPALIFYSIFRGRVQRLISELEAASTHLMALLAAQYKRAARAAATRQAFPPGGHLGSDGAPQ